MQRECYFQVDFGARPFVEADVRGSWAQDSSYAFFVLRRAVFAWVLFRRQTFESNLCCGMLLGSPLVLFLARFRAELVN